MHPARCVECGLSQASSHKNSLSIPILSCVHWIPVSDGSVTVTIRDAFIASKDPGLSRVGSDALLLIMHEK